MLAHWRWDEVNTLIGCIYIDRFHVISYIVGPYGSRTNPKIAKAKLSPESHDAPGWDIGRATETSVQAKDWIKASRWALLSLSGIIPRYFVTTSGLLHANHNARYNKITRLSFSSLSGRSPAGPGGSSSSHFHHLNLTWTFERIQKINQYERNHQLRQLLPNGTGTAMCPDRTQIAHPGLERNPANLLCAKHRRRQHDHFPGCIWFCAHCCVGDDCYYDFACAV